MQAAGPVAIGMILPAVKMHGKSSFSIVPHEKHVKMQVPGLSPRHPWGTDLGCFGGPRGSSGGSFGAVLGPQNDPQGPQNDPKRVPKTTKIEPKGSKTSKSSIFEPQGVRKGHFRSQKWLPGHHFGTVWGGSKRSRGIIWFHFGSFGSLLAPKMTPWRSPRGPK